MTKALKTLLLATTFCSLALSAASAAEAAKPAAAPVAPPAPTDFMSALTSGSFWLDARYRNESVHQDGTARDAEANTLRSIVGYNTGEFQHFKASVALLNNMQIGNAIYNDGGNGKTAYPSIGDPRDTQLFLANMTYGGLPATTAIVGRQQISLDQQRWVGAPQWRQISQTFDGVLVKNKSISDLELMYGFLFHQNRSPGTGVSNGTYDMNTHIMHAAYTGVKDVKFTGYTYLADIANTATGLAAGALSSATFGARVEASHAFTDWLTATGNLEYAHQTPYAKNPGTFALNYYAIEPGVTIAGVKTKFVYEYLGGNGTYAIQSPMMSSHAMNGWADKFTTTPVNGLEDAYVDVAYSFKLPYDFLDDTKLGLQIHDYNAAHISQHYGSEFDLDVVQNIAKHYAVGIQYEAYNADHNQTDTQKVILTGQVKF